METKQLLQEELQQLKAIQEKSQAVVAELGQIELMRLQLNNRRQNAEEFLKELEQEEKTLSEFLEQKYGKVLVNIETGGITASQ